MSKLLMISGDRSLAEGRRGAFYNTLEEFHKYWDRIDIICPGVKIPNLKSQIANKSQIPNSKCQTLNYFGNVFTHPSPWPLIAQPLWILRKGRQIYKEQKFDLMTVHEYPPFYNGIGARLLWNKICIPYVLEIHHIPGLPRAAGFKERFYKNVTRFFIRIDSVKARAVRVVNKKQVPDFLIEAGVPGDKIIYIPSFYIDLNVFRPMGLDKKYDLVFVARLEKNKGIMNLLKAVKILAKRKPDIKLLLIGDGRLKHCLAEYVWQNKLSENVHLIGWLKAQADVSRALNESKIFINPSFNEGGPRVAIEAMACGLPVITTRVGAMPDIIIDGESGLLTGWNPEEIADKIIWLLERPGIQDKFSSEGLKISKQFEKTATIKNYAKQLQGLIESR